MDSGRARWSHDGDDTRMGGRLQYNSSDPAPSGQAIFSIIPTPPFGLII